MSEQSTSAKNPSVNIVLNVAADQVVVCAVSNQCGTVIARRTYNRVGQHSFKTMDPDFHAHEDNIGFEVAEYMDALELPVAIANMLPRNICPPPADLMKQIQGDRRASHD